MRKPDRTTSARPGTRPGAMTRTVAVAIAVLGLALSAEAAEAAPGFVSRNINMRAGPDVSYPLVASLPQGTPVEIFGCLPGWTWCDTQTGGARGWVAGPGLAVLYDRNPEPLPGYGGAIGLPFVGFDFDSYWGSYYRGRPWFSREDRWHGGGPPGPWQGGPQRGGPDRFGPGRDGPGRDGPGMGDPGRGGPNGGEPGGPGGQPGRPSFPGGQGGYRPQQGGPGENSRQPGNGPGGATNNAGQRFEGRPGGNQGGNQGNGGRPDGGHGGPQPN